MKHIVIKHPDRVTLNGRDHDERSIRDLIGARIPYDPDRFAEVVAQDPSGERPPSDCIAIPIMSLIESLGQLSRPNACLYWFGATNWNFLAVPVQWCEFEEA